MVGKIDSDNYNQETVKDCNPGGEEEVECFLSLSLLKVFSVYVLPPLKTASSIVSVQQGYSPDLSG